LFVVIKVSDAKYLGFWISKNFDFCSIIYKRTGGQRLFYFYFL